MIVCPVARPPPAEGEDTEYQLKNKEKEGEKQKLNMLKCGKQ